MEFCAVNFVFFLCCIAVSNQFPSKEDTTREPVTTADVTEQPLVHLVEMGEGLTTLPQGNPSIKSINFAYNHIETLPDFIFYNNSYKGLHKIELCQNKITSVGDMAFKGLKQLKKVDLSFNNVTEINAYVFEYNKKLERLDLSNNKISFTRNNHFLVSSSLLTLDLSNNKIENLFAFSFVGLPKVRYLMLEFNMLNHIEPGSFKPLIDLQYLNLAHSALHRLTTNMFGPTPRIIDITETILANKFNPPLRKVKNTAVNKLLNIDFYL